MFFDRSRSPLRAGVTAATPERLAAQTSPYTPYQPGRCSYNFIKYRMARRRLPATSAFLCWASSATILRKEH